MMNGELEQPLTGADHARQNQVILNNVSGGRQVGTAHTEASLPSTGNWDDSSLHTQRQRSDNGLRPSIGGVRVTVRLHCFYSMSAPFYLTGPGIDVGGALASDSGHESQAQASSLLGMAM